MPIGTDVVLISSAKPLKDRTPHDDPDVIHKETVGTVVGFRMRHGDIPLVLVNWIPASGGTRWPRAIHPSQLAILDELDQEEFL